MGDSGRRFFRGRLQPSASRAALLALLTALGCLFVAPALASAAFPGINGRIAFDRSVGSGNYDIFTANADGSGQTNVTNLSGLDVDPSVSPDGKHIAWVSGSGNASEIWEMDIDGANKTQLTSNSAGDASPSWTPDGKKILFYSTRSGHPEVWIMDANGQNQTQLTSDPTISSSDPVMSPDGKLVAFVRSDGDEEIWTAAFNGSSLSSLTKRTNNSAIDRQPDFSPDGKKIVFASDRDDDAGKFEIYTMNADGTDQTRITTRVGIADFQPAYSPDGKKILFRSQSTANPDIWSMDADGANPVNLTQTLESEGDPSWQPAPVAAAARTHNGEIVFESTAAKDAPTHVSKVNPDGSGRTQLTDNAGFNEYAPSFSPTGARIAYWSDDDLDVYATDPLGSWTLDLSNGADTNQDREPSYSGDGNKLAFRSNRAGNYDIWAMDGGGSGQTQLTTGTALDQQPTYAPNAQRIAFTSDRDGNNEIYLMWAGGAGLTNLTNNTADDEDPTFSPDGTKIAFDSNRGGSAQVWTMNLDGTDLAQLTSSGKNLQPAFSPDGSKIAFASNRDGDFAIYTMNVDGTGQTKVTGGSGSDVAPSWGPGPDTSIDSGTADGATIGDASATFTFSSADPATRSFECSLDGNAFGACSDDGTDTESDLADGQHTFSVRAVDLYGNWDGEPPARTFTVDTTPPVVSLTAPADGSTTVDSTPELDGTAGQQPGDAGTVTVDIYSGSVVAGSPQQSLDADVAVDGSYSIVPPAALPDGTYTAQASQSDAVGNVGTSGLRTFTVDANGPTVTLTSPAAGSTVSDQTPSFAGVAGTAPGDAPAVGVDVYAGQAATGAPLQTLQTTAGAGGAYAVSPDSALAEGTYTAQASQSDGVGNEGRSAAVTFTVSVPKSPPPSGHGSGSGSGSGSGPSGSAPQTNPALITKLTRVKINRRKRKATFRFRGSGGALSFQCRLDREKFRRCRSPKKYRRLMPGKHVFRVRAVDAGGAVDATPAKRKFRIPRHRHRRHKR